jgi:hypothetical protein
MERVKSDCVLESSRCDTKALPEDDVTERHGIDTEEKNRFTHHEM